jgi:hypothetical protein
MNVNIVHPVGSEICEGPFVPLGFSSHFVLFLILLFKLNACILLIILQKIFHVLNLLVDVHKLNDTKHFSNVISS